MVSSCVILTLMAYPANLHVKTSLTPARYKLTKNRGSFPSDEALVKLFLLALRNISKKWTLPIRDWKAALTRFTTQFGERISMN